MADGFNQAILLGNLGADPELRFTAGGEPVLNMRVATSRSWQKEGGEREDKTEWHNVVIFGKRAEGLAKILTKGSRIHVTGEIRYSQWEKDGQKHTRADVVVQTLTLCDGKRPDVPEAAPERPQGQRRSGSASRKPAGQAPPAKADPYGDELPY